MPRGGSVWQTPAAGGDQLKLIVGALESLQRRIASSPNWIQPSSVPHEAHVLPTQAAPDRRAAEGVRGESAEFVGCKDW